MTHTYIKANNLHFQWQGADTPLFSGFDLHLERGWTGLVGPNGSGKTTLCALLMGKIEPTGGSVSGSGLALYCPQRTDDPPELMETMMTDSAGYRYQGVFGMEYDWLDRWDTLSHGERKRAQIAVALWREPHILAIDEPSNHIDSETRVLLNKALRSFRGVGLLVSHDRQMLDELCSQCLFLDGVEPILIPGGYTKGSGERERTRLTQLRIHEKARQEKSRLEREFKRRAEEVSKSKKRLSKRGVSAKDHDAKGKIDAARLTGKDARAGRLLDIMASRVQHAKNQQMESIPDRQYDGGIQFEASLFRKRVIHFDPGLISMGAYRELRYPALTVRAGERLAMTGPNGAGKSTLINHLMSLTCLNHDELLYVPQEMTAIQGATLLREARDLPAKTLGRLGNIVSRLGSNPRAILQSDNPSPGETRKLMLALGLIKDPALIVMDEPTNHLDLQSVEHLEQALLHFPGSMILISHDQHFLDKLTTRMWRLEIDESTTEVVIC